MSLVFKFLEVVLYGLLSIPVVLGLGLTDKLFAGAKLLTLSPNWHFWPFLDQNQFLWVF